MSRDRGRSFLSHLLDGSSLVAAQKLEQTGDLRHLGTIQRNTILSSSIEDHYANIRDIEDGYEAERVADKLRKEADERMRRATAETEARRWDHIPTLAEVTKPEPARGTTESVDAFLRDI